LLKSSAKSQHLYLKRLVGLDFIKVEGACPNPT